MSVKQTSKSAVFDWFNAATEHKIIPLDNSESEPLAWQFESIGDPSAGKVDDLTDEAERQDPDDPPSPGGSDQIIAFVKRVMDDFCHQYEQLQLSLFDTERWYHTLPLDQ